MHDAPSARLRVVACGSVDDGKSTLLGRLLLDTGTVSEDRLQALRVDSRRFGTRGGKVDPALLLDALEAEREQGITVDVAYRYATLGAREVVVADAPGHEQYTRNMAVAASTADCALLLVDARHGLRPQTRRHARILAWMGVRAVLLAVNKMDLVDWNRDRFDDIANEFTALAAELGWQAHAMPVSALDGANVCVRGGEAPWYAGATLLDWLQLQELRAHAPGPLRLPVQLVLREPGGARLQAGTIAQGTLRRADTVLVQPAGQSATVADIRRGSERVEQAAAGDAVALRLEPDVDVGRGDVLVAASQPLPLASRWRARLVVVGDRPLRAGQSLRLKLHHATLGARILALHGRVDPLTGGHQGSAQLSTNELGLADLELERPIPFAPYAVSREFGGFLLLDREDHATLAAGMIEQALDEARELHWQATAVDRRARGLLLRQVPRCIWFTGLSGAGKSTWADRLERTLHLRGRHTYLLDGDNLRHGLCRDLGFTLPERGENVRRAAEVARLMVDAGLIVLVALISPLRDERAFARSLFAPGEFVEVFVDTPIEECERRDRKGLYARARRGELAEFTGVSSPYEVPAAPEIRLHDIGDEAAAVQALSQMLHIVGEGDA